MEWRANFRRLALLALVTATPLALSATSAISAETVTISSTLETLDSFVPQFGQDQGIFEKHGIQLEYVKGNNGPALLSAVVGGSADITHVGAALNFPAIQKGAALSILMGNYDIDYTFIARKDAGVDGKKPYPEFMHDLKGKRVGVAGRGGATELYVRKMLTDAGMNPDTDVTFIAVGTGVAAAGAFTNDQVDAMAALPPSPTIIGKENYDVLVDLNTTKNKVFNSDYLFTIFTANADFVKNRPEVALNFCKAAKETIEAIKDPANLDKVVGFFESKLKLDKAKATEIIDDYKANFNATLTKDRLEKMKAFTSFVPDWNGYVYEPCAELTSK